MAAGLAPESAPVSSGQGDQTCRGRASTGGGQAKGTGGETTAPAPAGVRASQLTVVVLALLQGLAETLTQGQVALSGGAVQELPDLIGAGPHLLGLRGSAGRGLRLQHRKQQGQLGVGTQKRTPELGVPAAPPNAPSPARPSLPCVASAAPSLKQGEPTALSKPPCWCWYRQHSQLPHNRYAGRWGWEVREGSRKAQCSARV